MAEMMWNMLKVDIIDSQICREARIIFRKTMHKLHLNKAEMTQNMLKANV